MSPTKAVVYIPDDVKCDEALLARQGVAHIERRGYRFAGVLRKWKHVLEHAAEGTVVVFANQEHAATVSKWKVEREFVGEETCHLIPIVQDLAAPRPRTGYGGPLDESPTVALLDRWRAARRQSNDREAATGFPRGDDGGFAERFLRSRRNARDQ